jgi:hypothetical protein
MIPRDLVPAAMLDRHARLVAHRFAGAHYLAADYVEVERIVRDLLSA